jgi:hypothetical protein
MQPISDFPVPTLTMDEKIERFIELETERRELEARLKEVKEEIAPLHEQVLTYFEQTGTSKIKRSGLTLYVHRQLWARPIDGDYERGCAALKAAGLEDMVKESFNIHTLSAYIRELERMGEPIPETFEGAIQTEETFQIRTRS